MKNYYTNERNVQILIYLLKAHGIKKIIISPGSANVAFSYSVQQDGGFELYSCVDERSAAYLACGLAAETGEAVALSCTGATASRNYIPALTEAYYRKLPILAITASRFSGNIGQLIPQMLDRSVCPRDIVNLSVDIPIINTAEEEWSVEIKVNRALLELQRKNGCGPVHINLQTAWTREFSAKHLPEARVINRITDINKLPAITQKAIGIFVGAHTKWKQSLTQAVDRFCAAYNAVVLCDHTSNYEGQYGILASLVLSNDRKKLNDFDVLIHLGEVSGAYYPLQTKEVWRVSPDGEIRDPFKKLRYVFELQEEEFFSGYIRNVKAGNERSFLEKWRYEYKKLYQSLPELPFSNLWVAMQTAKRLPPASVLHLGILNSLRCWNFFEIPEKHFGYCNTGGFGIDGCVSTLVGASLAKPEQLYFGFVGDLAFFYDMNILGNRHIGSNIRLMIINNALGVEMKLKGGGAFLELFGNDVDDYIAAKGQFGNKSRELIKNYVTDLGFEYLSASSKSGFEKVIERFTQKEITERSMVLEVFTDDLNESAALDLIRNLQNEKKGCEEEKGVRKKVIHPQVLREKSRKWNVVLWGGGFIFDKYLTKISQNCNVQNVCDNDSKKWGKTIKGIKCISPQELLQKKDVFVVIMVEDIATAFCIATQLQDMGIRTFDTVFNFLNYSDWASFV